MWRGSETILITAKGSTGQFTLPDGTNVRLNSDTRLIYDPESFMADGKRRVSIEGEAFFDVTKDAEHPFVVKLTDMEVEVLGTSFDVRNYSFSSKEEVVLLTGKVKVESKGIGEPVTIYPDQRLVFNRANGDCDVQQTAAINYCRWIEPRLKLENEPLGDLLITLSRKYNLELEIAPDVDLTKRISLTLHNDDIEDLMPVIAYLTDLSYKIENNTLYIN
jgi:transmembrane sensor